ncbi:B12-binding domain-containing radical SAM protein [Vibrio coralliilyticus]|uniref:B12-binding domain-containing radical SAM protein n=1 Tax=Vibrio coralliilyticus TaxID=190893 RepID=UPI0009BCA24E|nr:radical SAM protein [Vibrio coralliilyticus]AXN31878.1 radical SAM protein [Vibrio coralliilyticus]
MLVNDKSLKIDVQNVNGEESKFHGKRCFLFYPPGPMYQRGEDRSQGNISDSAATVMRAPNDMGYASAILKSKNCDVFFTDYPSENKYEEHLLSDFDTFNPDVIIVSITNSTIRNDLSLIDKLKKRKNDINVILKGALFFDSPPELIEELDLSNVDYLIGGEIEFAIGALVLSHYTGYPDIKSVPGIMYKNEDDSWEKNIFGAWEGGIDDLPFPDRSVINNELYVRPDTGQPQATIVTSRGCPAACIYCLTPTISGKKVRFRSAENILEELRDCYHNHGIKDFFFRSDTFTINHDWVEEVCSAINNSDLKGKIEWVANSRVRPLKDNTLQLMKDAGCWLVAFGFESGHPDTLKKIQKGATVKDNLRAARLAKEAGLKLYGFYLVGLPWENEEHLSETARHIFELDADFIEIHVALPYYGTELYDIASNEGLLDNDIIGTDYFHKSTKGTNYLTSDYLMKYRKEILLKYHLRPSYIINKLKSAILKPKVIKNYVRFGSRLIISNLK